jgi:predicted DNA-binding transcriptional regulator AlpA
MKRRLLTVRDVAEITGWKEAVRHKVWRREIEFVKLGRSIRFRAEVIDSLIEEAIVPVKNEFRPK